MLLVGRLAHFFYRLIATQIMFGWLIGAMAFFAMLGFLIGGIIAMSVFGTPLGRSGWERMRGAGSVVVTHSMTEVRALCSAGAVLENGELTYFDDVEDAIAQHLANMGTAG